MSVGLWGVVALASLRETITEPLAQQASRLDRSRRMGKKPSAKINAWKTLLGVSLGASFLLAASGSARAQNPDISGSASNSDNSFYYSYFKEQIPLRLDETRLIVTDLSAMGDDAVRSFAAGFGVSADAITAHAAPNTYVIEVPTWGVADAQLTRQLIATMASEATQASIFGGAADLFVSPAFNLDLGPAHITEGLMVRFVAGTTPEEAIAIASAYIEGVQLVEANFAGMADVYHFTTASRDGFELLDAANQLAARADTIYAEPNMQLPLKKDLIPNDPLFSVQWALRNTGQSGGVAGRDVDAELAWDITPGFPNILVAILDDGVQQDHPDIHQVPGIDATGQGTGGGPASTCDNHGTAVAGCATATFNNGVGVAGVAPGTRTISVKFSNSNPPCNGSGTFSPANFASGLNNAFGQGARVSNNSNSLGISSTIANVYQSTRNAGMVHFASTGNDNANAIGYPSSLATVNAVGAITRQGNRASFSNYGTGIAFAAPGVAIWTTDRTGSAGYSSGSHTSTEGTSFSSPIAAGVAALVVSANPTLSAVQVETILQENAKDLGAAGHDQFFGWGIPDADDSMEAAIALLNAPGNINLATPADGLTEVDPDAVRLFAWTTTTGANFYRFEIATDTSFASPVFSLDTFTNINNLDISVLADGTQYYWRARPFNLAGNGNCNPAYRSFTTIGFTEPSVCPGDLNEDGVIDADDLGILLAAFGASDAGDLNDDGITNADDLGMLLTLFGTVCP